MHPTRDELRGYCRSGEDGEDTRALRAHLEQCEFCREYCAEFRAQGDFVAAELERPTAAATLRAADRIYRAALAGTVIRMTPTAAASAPQPYLMAADGGAEPAPRLESLATLFSENPEVVLRIMRDNSRRREYLQLVSEDERLVSRVLVQVPELDLNVVTDEHGRGDVEWARLEDFTRYGWRVKLPDAEFSLSPLQYDPERVEYHEETVLETDRGDKIGIRFEGRTEGKRLTLRVLQVEGRAEFDPVRVVVSQAAESVTRSLSRTDALELVLSSPADLIAIRLFSETHGAGP